MKYNNHLNYRDRKRLLLKLRIIFVIIALILTGVAMYFYIDYARSKSVNTDKSATSDKTTSYIAPSVSIFKTPYYQFQAPNSWVEVPNESNSSKFVYRSIKSSLIEHDLIVYVNQIPANLEANRVLPVTLKSNSTELEPESVSEHCIKALNGQSSSQKVEVTFNKVKFSCDSDSTNYTVMVGQIQDDTVINLNRPGDLSATYTFYYTNLRAIQDGNELVEIIKTFQTR